MHQSCPRPAALIDYFLLLVFYWAEATTVMRNGDHGTLKRNVILNVHEIPGKRGGDPRVFHSVLFSHGEARRAHEDHARYLDSVPGVSGRQGPSDRGVNRERAYVLADLCRTCR